MLLALIGMRLKYDDLLQPLHCTLQDNKNGGAAGMGGGGMGGMGGMDGMY